LFGQDRIAEQGVSRARHSDGASGCYSLRSLPRQCVPGRERVHIVSPVRDFPVFNGGLNRSTQHFILKGKDGVWDGTEIS
jgi:hypothetical protein